jgi:hypothetical protein
MRVIALVEGLVPALPPSVDPSAFPRADQDESMAAALDASGGSGGVSRVQVMRFVRLLSGIMADQLRAAVLSSIDACREFWLRYDVVPGSPEALAGYPDAELPVTRPVPPPAGTTATTTALHRAPVARWGGDLYSPVPAQLFMLQLVVRGNSLALEPGLA